MFINEPSRVAQGKGVTGDAIIKGRELEEGKMLLGINICTDSKHACGLVYMFRNLWEERGLTCRGKNIST